MTLGCGVEEIGGEELGPPLELLSRPCPLVGHDDAVPHSDLMVYCVQRLTSAAIEVLQWRRQPRDASEIANPAQDDQTC